MSNYVPRPNTGTLWPNSNKQSPNHPDLRGDVVVDVGLLKSLIDKSDGNTIKLQVAGWQKVIAQKDCVSLSISAPYVKQTAAEKVTQNYVDDEDVPF